jgi:hypothetical protein
MADLASQFGDLLASVFMALMGIAGIQLSGNVAHSATNGLIVLVSAVMLLIAVAVFALSLLGIAQER